MILRLMTRHRFGAMALAVLMTGLGGCMSASDHAAEVGINGDGKRVTPATVQREIRVGMPSASVVEALGTPNMISTDEQRREVWVYDRVASEEVYSESSRGILYLIFGGSSSRSGARRQNQRTFTVIIKFDNDQRVRDFAYQTTSF